MVVLVLVPLVQCFALTARAMYLCARACILVQCFVMGNPRHVRILVVLVSARVMYLLARGRTRSGPNFVDRDPKSRPRDLVL